MSVLVLAFTHAAQIVQTIPATVPAAAPAPGVTAGGARAIVVGLRMNPAFWLMAAFAVGSALEAVLVLALFRSGSPAGKRCSAALSWAVHPLTGSDGRPSFSKIVDLLILGGYWSGAPIPAGVAMLVIGSAHGSKVLLAIIARLTPDPAGPASSVPQARTHAEQITALIDRVVGRGPTGEPLRSVAAVPGATTPAGEP